MELDSRKKSRRDRMMRLKSFEMQEVREIGRKEAGESRGSGRTHHCLPNKGELFSYMSFKTSELAGFFFTLFFAC